MKKQSGYSLTEIMIAVGVVGILSVSSGYAYLNYLPKFQAGEALSLINAEKAKIIKNNACTVSNSGAVGKYGTLSVSGTYARSASGNCLTGCQFTYTFNQNNSVAALKGKVIQAQLLSSGALSKVEANTTVSAKNLPRLLNYVTPQSTSQCNVVSVVEGMEIESVVNPTAISGTATGRPAATTPDGNGDDTNPGGNPTTPDTGNPTTPSTGNPPNSGDNTSGGGISDHVPTYPTAPKNETEKANRIEQISTDLSKPAQIVVIQPQGFDFTVEARPYRGPRAEISKCRDVMTFKGNETIIRPTPDFVTSPVNPHMSNIFYHLGVLKLQDIVRHAGLTQVKDGKTVIDRPIRIYVPCSYYHISPNSVDPAWLFTNYVLSDNAYIQIDNFGVITGRGGSPGDVMIKLEGNPSWLDRTSNNLWQNYNVETNAAGRYLSKITTTPLNLTNKMYFTGGVALINNNTQKPLIINNAHTADGNTIGDRGELTFKEYPPGRISRGEDTGLSWFQKWGVCYGRGSISEKLYRPTDACIEYKNLNYFTPNHQTIIEPQNLVPTPFIPIAKIAGGIPFGDTNHTRVFETGVRNTDILYRLNFKDGNQQYTSRDTHGDRFGHNQDNATAHENKDQTGGNEVTWITIGNANSDPTATNYEIQARPNRDMVNRYKALAAQRLGTHGIYGLVEGNRITSKPLSEYQADIEWIERMHFGPYQPN